MYTQLTQLNFFSSGLELENTFRNFSFGFLFSAMFYYWSQIAFNFTSLKYNVGNLLILLANLSLVILLILRWNNSGHFPLSNLYESLMFLSWSCTMLHFFLLNTATIFRNSPNPMRLPKMMQLAQPKVKDLQQKIIGSITAPSALLMNAYATFSLPKEMQQVAPLVPALQSNWLMMHVTVMILSYAALILGSLLSVAFLIITFHPSYSIANNTRITYPPKATSGLGCETKVFASWGEAKPISPISSYLTYLLLWASNEGKITEGEITEGEITEGEIKKVRLPKVCFAREATLAQPKIISVASRNTPLVENLENYSYRLIGIGFSFLTIGILSGAVWANEAWGSYWSWDPKETWAFLTWLVYAIYLHTRLTKGWEGTRPAILASIGFITVWICFLGVNLIGEGLHSYGWFVKAA
jgi:cytochrome c-type biogenesis protein CcsB